MAYPRAPEESAEAQARKNASADGNLARRRSPRYFLAGLVTIDKSVG